MSAAPQRCWLDHEDSEATESDSDIITLAPNQVRLSSNLSDFASRNAKVLESLLADRSLMRQVAVSLAAASQREVGSPGEVDATLGSPSSKTTRIATLAPTIDHEHDPEAADTLSMAAGDSGTEGGGPPFLRAEQRSLSRSVTPGFFSRSMRSPLRSTNSLSDCLDAPEIDSTLACVNCGLLEVN